jgi:hypothetical protein
MRNYGAGISLHGEVPLIAAAATDGGGIVDSAISHLEKLRRVLLLEEWLRDARGNPLLAASCRSWRAEREELLLELNLKPDQHG